MGPSPGPLRAVPLGGGPASIAALLPEQPDYQTCWRRPTSRIPLSTTRREAPASAAIAPQSDAMPNSVNPAKMSFTASEKPKRPDESRVGKEGGSQCEAREAQL